MKKWIVVIVSVLLFSFSALGKEEMVSLDFDKADIHVVIKLISELTGKNFLIDEKVRGTVTIVCPTKIPISEVYKVFESILEIKGFTTVPCGNLVKIVPIREAQQKNIEVRVGKDISEPLEEDKVITQIIPLDYISVDEAVSLINPLKSANTNLILCRSANSLILTDTSANIRRLMRIIKEIDNEERENLVTLLPLKVASAPRLYKELTPLIKNLAKPGRKIKVFVDERTNSLIIVANKKDTQMLKNLVVNLDKEVPLEHSEIHIYYVKHTDAQSLAQVLSQAFAQIKGRVGPQVPKLKASPSIVADKNTNSLIITASPQDYASLKKIIDKLDIKTRQVLVEVLIAEVTLDTTKQLGIEWAEDLGEYRKKDIFAGTNYGMKLESLSGNLYGLGIGFLDDENIALILHSYESDSKVNILSTPHILTNDNQEAEISIGKVVPLLKDSRISEQETVIRTYEYKDVGIKLQITPHINPEGYVRLEINQEIQKLTENTLYEAPLMTKRQAKTMVTVQNGKTVVIGGLIRDDKTQIIKKTPFLGDIPLLGWFFKRKVWTTEKTNLLLFITPHVINSDQDLERLTKEKKSTMERTPKKKVK